MIKLPYQSQSLTVNALWLTAAKGLAFCFTFFLPILLVRQMSQTEFGHYRQVFLAVNTMITVLPLGFAMSAYYFLPRERMRKGQVIFNIVLFYLCIGAVSGLALIIRPDLLAALFDSPELAAYGRGVGLVVLFWTASSFFEMVAVAHGETYFAALFVVASQLSRASLLLTAALWIGSLQSLIYAALLHGVIQFGVLWAYLTSRFPGFWRRFDWSLMCSQLSYAVPLGVAALLGVIQTDFHNYVVSHRFGAAAYAVYAIGTFQLPLLGILRESVGAVMIGRVSELRKDEDVREIISLTARMMRKLALLLFPMFVFLFVTKQEFIVVLFTDKYLQSASLFAINLIMIPLTMISSGYDPVFRAYPEHVPFFLRVRVVLALLVFPALWIGTEYFRLEGAIAAVVGLGFVERVVLSFKAARILGTTWRDLPLFTDVGKLALAATVSGGGAFFVREWAFDSSPLIVLLTCGMVFAVTYALTVLLLGVLTQAERQVVRSWFSGAVMRAN